MIIVTGAFGFIGSYLIGELNRQNITDIIAVDDFSQEEKDANLADKKILERVDRLQLDEWFRERRRQVDFIFHLGARTDTTETDINVLNHLNTEYSKMVWRHARDRNIPLVYASSAATYGSGENGYNDTHDCVDRLLPLNEYGRSKNEFDKWVLGQVHRPKYWAGLKFFNVYGPNEYHKGRMASVIFHAYKQIQDTGRVKLFRSHNPDFEDGCQLRDFIYVKDVASILIYFMRQRPEAGLYNVGTGEARTFLDLANATFQAMELTPDIQFIDTPGDIRDKYQYFTEANMDKLRNSGYNKSFTSMEDGIADYVQNFLKKNKTF